MRKLVLLIVCYVVFSAYNAVASPANSGEAIGLLGQRLVVNKASWLANEKGYLGQTTLALVEAYRKTLNVDYLNTAQDAADAIYTYSYGGYYGLIGDEAGAFAELAEVTGNTANNHILNYFYNDYIAYYTGGLSVYFDDMESQIYATGGDKSVVIYYLAAYYRGANAPVASVASGSLALWKNALVSRLQELTDSNGYAPVQAVGAAVWALAQSGLLDDTTLIWDNMTLKDGVTVVDVTIASLPAFLATRIIEEGDDFYVPGTGWQTIVPNPYAGGFYQGLGYEEVGGFTADSALALLGIASALDTYNDWSGLQDPSLTISKVDLEAVRDAARTALFKGIANDGTVYNHLFDPDEARPYYFFAADVLSAIAAAVIPGDTDLNDVLDITDVIVLSENWFDDNTTLGYWGNVSDLNNDFVVNLEDFAIVASGY